MSTFLELCQKTVRLCHIADTGPTAVTGQTGELQDIVDYVIDAWTEIQNRHNNWRWLRRAWTLNTVADDDSYAFGDVTDVDAGAVITRFGHWHADDRDNPPKIFLTSSGNGGERWHIYTPWHWWNTIYAIGPQTSSEPVHITIDPQDNIRVGPPPDGVYTMEGEFFRSAQILAADGDIPEMPTQFHMLIVYMAMQKYGMLESAPEVVAMGNQEGRKIMRQLELNQLPKFRLARPLA